MSPEQRMSLATLSRLKRELQADVSALRMRQQEVQESIDRWGEPPDKAVVTFGAAAIHAWYTALEGALERAARILDGDVPSGDRWHQDLLSQAFTEVPGVRPAVLTEALQPDLLACLAFRHFFRHAYAVVLNPDKVKAELERLDRLADGVAGEVEAFMRFVSDAMAQLCESS